MDNAYTIRYHGVLSYRADAKSIHPNNLHMARQLNLKMVK